ncbi:thioredoxin domain-containing protein [Muriicola sp. Z0-33]|uniref:thioredoxin domain-containing protein n=1 Tax=Muriicola sp. Z0-33 TaxID=2816957 RepID=UPI002237EE18|nr:thioredoxin domain-containing protein [Muriicola sp. Z0-33]MCW5516214.1 thioredoxin domain-containing protein [Muriicola sp. Z0-33]
MTHEYTNDLIKETSPYLLQHAHNPVNWEAWKPEVLHRAKKENKLLLISIGYAACHWCHVMEEECFEDPEVAEVMNSSYVNIKIDREERPDVDHIYMDALQMMTGSGGWPLNIVALPDGRPFWGATYVKKADWIRVLDQLQDLYKKDPGKIEDYAQKLAEGLKTINLVSPPETAVGMLELDQLQAIYKDWEKFFDTKMGGYNRAPKFMMPVNLNFLLHYSTAMNDISSLEYVNTTLTKMAYGGVYDHVGGGFARYSVDDKWHVPHFEKMLYDNGQLISVYSKAYAATGNSLYKKVVEESISFVMTELMDESFGFYSSLDADSYNSEKELEEGAYYVWNKQELEPLLGENFELFKSYYNINSYGHWEKGNYVLIRDESDEAIAKKHDISAEVLRQKINDAKHLLLKVREKRDKPRLDDKILTSWNGLMLSGLIDAYKYLGNEEYLKLALKNASFIKENLIKADGGMYRNHKNGTSSINGYLEDLVTVANAFMQLYEVTADEKWLQQSKALLDYCIANYQDPESGLFYFTSKKDDYVIRRTIETADNVIPSSNSIMALTLFKMSKIFLDSPYEEIALNMFGTIQETIQESGHNHANWLNMPLYFNKPFYEIAVVGEKYEEIVRTLQANYLPNTVFAATAGTSQLSLLQNRLEEGNTLVYVCQQGSCKLPVTTPAEVMEQITQASDDR